MVSAVKGKGLCKYNGIYGAAWGRSLRLYTKITVESNISGSSIGTDLKKSRLEPLKISSTSADALVHGVEIFVTWGDTLEVTRPICITFGCNYVR